MQYAACIYILWGVPQDMPYNINREHIVRIYFHVLANQDYIQERPDTKEKRRDSHK